jgi:hypothetical protein
MDLNRRSDNMSALATGSSRAAQALRQSVHPALRRLLVEETDDTIVITGHVSSYYLKQMAQEAVMALGDTPVVVNRVLVMKE